MKKSPLENDEAGIIVEETAPDYPLHGFQTYGWKPVDHLTDDENIMDLVLIVTRASKLRQGGMGCVLLRPKLGNDLDCKLQDRIISVANNHELYTSNSSDIHAEVMAIGAAAQAGRSTKNCTAYITMPPCKKCFGALVAAGVKRVVSIHDPPRSYETVLQRVQVEMVGVASAKDNYRRVNDLVATFSDVKLQEVGSSDEDGEKP